MIVREIRNLFVDGITLWPFVFVRKEQRTMGAWNRLIRHEKIHIEQQKELLVIPFYILYVFFFLWKLFFVYHSWDAAYRSIPFEEEAYENETRPSYLKNRKFWGWTAYL